MDLDSIHKNFVDSQNSQGLGTLTGLAKMLKGAGTPAAPTADAGTAKIPLAMLPAGVQPGQRVSLTITGIDAVSGVATVVPDAVQNAVPPAPEKPKADVIDKELTMGPMDNLRSYLFQKTQDQEEQ